MPIFKIGNEYADEDFSLLSRHLNILDIELTQINEEISKCADAESAGLYDAGEYFIGHGFVAIQRYLTSTRAGLRISQSDAFTTPPMVTSDLTLVEAINAGANYWKHMEEWIETINKEENSELKGNALRTLSKLELLTPWDDYTCANLMAVLRPGHAMELSSLLPDLAKWRNNLMDRRS